jgi:hypothetical protein
MRVNITSRYGEVSNLHPTGHTGIDLGISDGTPLRSLFDGVVERVVDYGAENIGKGVIVRFADGSQGIYGHMSRIIVKEGQRISEGDKLGLSGNTGFSTGPHLHFGLKEDGSFVDPTPLADKLGEYSSEFVERGSVAQNDYPSMWGWIYEKVIGEGLGNWAADFIGVLPILAVISLGVFGFINMFSSSLAKYGVIGIFILGGIALI